MPGASAFTEALVSRGIVEACVKLITAGTDAVLRRLALNVVANLLTCDDRVRMMLLDEGGLDLLYDLFIDASDRDLQKGALRCIMYLGTFSIAPNDRPNPKISLCRPTVSNLEQRSFLTSKSDFYKTLIKCGKRLGDENIHYIVVCSSLDTYRLSLPFGFEKHAILAKEAHQSTIVPCRMHFNLDLSHRRLSIPGGHTG